MKYLYIRLRSVYSVPDQKGEAPQNSPFLKKYRTFIKYCTLHAANLIRVRTAAKMATVIGSKARG